MALPPESVRQMRARAGGYALAASRDPLEYTSKARSTFASSFLNQVDPLGQLSEGERLRRAEAARRLYFTRLALKSAKVRAKRNAAPTTGDAGAAQEVAGGSSTDIPQPV